MTRLPALETAPARAEPTLHYPSHACSSHLIAAPPCRIPARSYERVAHDEARIIVVVNAARHSWQVSLGEVKHAASS